MSTWEAIKDEVESALPRARLVNDLWASLKGDYGATSTHGRETIEIPDDHSPLSIPLDIEVTYIGVSVVVEYVSKSFGAFKAVLALGGATPVEHSNVLKPGLVFATLFYNQNCEMITYDLHEEWF